MRHRRRRRPDPTGPDRYLRALSGTLTSNNHALLETNRNEELNGTTEVDSQTGEGS